MKKYDQLICTKLLMPFIRHGLVSHLRLQGQIVQELRGPLTLISAPAVYDKTTLLAEKNKVKRSLALMVRLY
jgi:ATP/maltotriose-dependent transcriptional regulator MalT